MGTSGAELGQTQYSLVNNLLPFTKLNDLNFVELTLKRPTKLIKKGFLKIIWP